MSDPESSAPRRQGWKTTLRALRNRNYRLFYIGQGISMIGTWMQMLAVGWLVNRLTGSAAWLGASMFVNRIPGTILTPLAGVLVDRYDKHRIIVWAQILAMAQALFLGLLTLHGVVQLWHVMALGLGLGIVGAIEMPARQSFFVELLESKDDLSNAIALNSTLFHGARLIGPIAAGYLVAAYPNEGPCFIVNGISYLAVIAGLLMMRLEPRQEQPQHRALLEEFREGVEYVRQRPYLRDLMIWLAAVSLIGMPYPTLLPIYATDVLHGSSRILGFLYSASGCGALIGALMLAHRTKLLGLGRLVPIATAVYGVAAIGLGLSHHTWLSLCLMPFVAGGLMTQGASSNTVVQSLCDSRMQGRVVSLYMLAAMGLGPFGSLLIGFVADHMGVPAAFILGGGLCIGAAVVFMRHVPHLRRRLAADGDETHIYGLLPGAAATEALPSFGR